MLSILAIMAFFPMIFSPFVAYGAYRENDRSLLAKSSACFAVCFLIFLAAPKPAIMGGSECTTEWDGYANPSVCN